MLQNLQHLPQTMTTRRPFRMKRRPEERVQVLGGAMDLVKAAEVFHFMRGKIATRERAIVANHNLHSLYLMRTSPEIRDFFAKADLIEVDSAPLIMWARLNGRPSRRFHRCTYLDWRDAFWEEAQAAGWRVFFLGGAPGVAEMARSNLLAQWPGVELSVRHGYFDMASGSADNAAILDEIAAFRPDILLVGMGMPRQEAWVARNYEALPPCVTLTVGGAFDYEAGVQIACPRWLGQLGLEWLFRLSLNPRRMFSRYCVEPWMLVGPAMGDLIATAKRKLSGADRAERKRMASVVRLYDATPPRMTGPGAGSLARPPAG
jgi:N-acetylglucosaminyldiphosphoundecaprenol N-acetyl-beta-D-mannosaminyltransferase